MHRVDKLKGFNEVEWSEGRGQRRRWCAYSEIFTLQLNDVSMILRMLKLSIDNLFARESLAHLNSFDVGEWVGRIVAKGGTAMHLCILSGNGQDGRSKVLESFLFDSVASHQGISC